VGKWGEVGRAKIHRKRFCEKRTLAPHVCLRNVCKVVLCGLPSKRLPEERTVNCLQAGLDARR